MNVSVKEIIVDTEYIDPTLRVLLEVEWWGDQVSPIYFSGRISLDKVGIIGEFYPREFEHNNEVIWKVFGGKEPLSNNTRSRRRVKHVRLCCPLSRRSLLAIEEARHNQSDGSVHLSIVFECKFMSIYASFLKKYTSGERDIETARLWTENQIKSYRIPKSDWVDDIAPKLGLTKTKLVELPDGLPEEVPLKWKKLYSELSDMQNSMNQFRLKGDWEESVLMGITFFDRLELGLDNTDALMLKRNIQKRNDSLGGFEDLQGVLKGVKGYAAQFSHSISKKDRANPKREDAEYLYSQTVALMKLISGKFQ